MSSPGTRTIFLKKAEKLFAKFKEGKYNSINEFAKSEECFVTQPTLWNLWRKYIPEYRSKKRYAFSSSQD